MPDFDIAGDPDAIDAKAAALAARGKAMHGTGDALAAIDADGWTGRAADHFRDAFDLEPGRWRDAGRGFEDAAEALLTYSAALRNAKVAAVSARLEYERGQRASDRGADDYRDYMVQMRAYWDSGGAEPAEPYVDPGAVIRDGAVTALAEVRKDLEEAGRVCAGSIRRACAHAPEEPHWWESGLRFVAGIFEGAGEAIWDLLTMAPFSPINLVIDGYTLATGQLTPEEMAAKYRISAEDAWATAKGMYNGLTTDPVEFGKNIGKGLLDWDTWADDPARAIGHLVPDAIVAVATAGTGAAATRIGKGGLDAIDALADLRKLDGLDDLNRLHRLPDDVKSLVDTPIDELSTAEKIHLNAARDQIQVAPGTEMQRVIPDDAVADYLRGSSKDPFFKPDQAFGFTSRAEDVSHLRNPKDMFDALGLDYRGTKFAPGDDSIHVLRYAQDDPANLQVPQHSDLGGPGKFDADAMDPSNPFTGNGYTSGGIPEFRTDLATNMDEGAQIVRFDKAGHEQVLATLTDVNGTLKWVKSLCGGQDCMPWWGAGSTRSRFTAAVRSSSASATRSGKRRWMISRISCPSVSRAPGAVAASSSTTSTASG